MRKQLLLHSHFKYAIYSLVSIILLAQGLAIYGTTLVLGQNQADFTFLSVENSQGSNLQIKYNTTNIPLAQVYDVELFENNVTVQNRFQPRTNFRHQIAIVLDVNTGYLADSQGVETLEKPQRYLRDFVEVLYLVRSEYENAEFSLIIPNVDTPNQIVPFEQFRSFMSLTYIELGKSSQEFNDKLQVPGDEATLLRNTWPKFDSAPEVQKTLLFIGDGKGSYNGNDLSTHIKNTLQDIPSTLRIFTIPISESSPNIDRDALRIIAETTKGGSTFEFSQFPNRTTDIQTVLNADWTISYTTQQTQPFTLGLKIAGLKKSTQITQGLVVPTATTSVATPTATSTPQPPAQCDEPGQPRCPLLSWWQTIVISALFIALIMWILVALLWKRDTEEPPTEISPNGNDIQLPPINNQLSHVELITVKGSADSPQRIEINHKYGDEVTLGRRPKQSFSNENENKNKIYVDGEDGIGVSRDHCLLRRIPGGRVEVELIAENWIEIYSKGSEWPITLSRDTNNFVTEVSEGDEIHLGKSAIFKIKEIIRPRMYKDDDSPVDDSTKLSMRNVKPNEPEPKDYPPITPPGSNPIQDPAPTITPETSDPNGEHKEV